MAKRGIHMTTNSAINWVCALAGPGLACIIFLHPEAAWRLPPIPCVESAPCYHHQCNVASALSTPKHACSAPQVRQQAAGHMDAPAIRQFSHMLLAMADVQAVVIVLAERLQVCKPLDQCLLPAS